MPAEQGARSGQSPAHSASLSWKAGTGRHGYLSTDFQIAPRIQEGHGRVGTDADGPTQRSGHEGGLGRVWRFVAPMRPSQIVA